MRKHLAVLLFILASTSTINASTIWLDGRVWSHWHDSSKQIYLVGFREGMTAAGTVSWEPLFASKASVAEIVTAVDIFYTDTDVIEMPIRFALEIVAAQKRGAPAEQVKEMKAAAMERLRAKTGEKPR